MANRYWVGGSGNWSDTSHWSTTSGGAGGASIPTSSDDVIFDENSTSASTTVLFSVTSGGNYQAALFQCKSFSASGIDNSVTFGLSGSTQYLTVNGSFYGSPLLAWNLYILKLMVPAGSATIFKQDGTSIGYNGQVDIVAGTAGSGSLTLLGDVSCNSMGLPTMDITASGISLSVTGLTFTGSFSVTPTLDLTGSVLNIGYVGYSGFSQVFTSPLNTIDFTGSSVTIANNGGPGTTPSYFYIGKASTIPSLTLKQSTKVLLGHDTQSEPAHTFTNLTIEKGAEVRFASGATKTIGTLVADGTLADPIRLRSKTPGSQYTLSKSSGAVSVNYVDIQDSNVTGGATWNAYYSTDSGNNTGWALIGIPKLYPTSISSGEAFESPSFSPGITYVTAGSVDGAEAFGSPTLHMGLPVGSVDGAEAFGTLVVTVVVASIGDIASAESVSDVSFTTQFITGAGDISSGDDVGSVLITMNITADAGPGTAESLETDLVFVQGAPPPPPPTDWSALGKEDEKDYTYRVYDADGDFIGIWTDVKDQPEFTHRLNTPGTTMTVRLARTADTTVERRAALITQDGDRLTAEDGDRFVVAFQTNATVGEDTDVELNYNVDVYVTYGGFENLVTQDGDQLITEDGDNFIVDYGAPNGTRVFSGYIMDYESDYADEAGVTVTLASHGAELSQMLVMDGAKTSVDFASSSLESQLKSVLDTNPGVMTYDADSIEATGVNDASHFVLNTKLEAAESLYERSPDGWYWYGEVAHPIVHLHSQSPTPDHLFLRGYHIKRLALRRSIEQLRNSVYFVGDVVAGTTVFRKYEDTTSQAAWRKVVHRIIDRRYSVAGSMEKRALKEMSLFKNPVYVTTVEISAAKYDLETVRLGQVVGFRNFNNFIDGLSLQIVELKYTPSLLTLGLGMLLPTAGQMSADIEQQLLGEAVQNIPDTAS